LGLELFYLLSNISIPQNSHRVYFRSGALGCILSCLNASPLTISAIETLIISDKPLEKTFIEQKERLQLNKKCHADGMVKGIMNHCPKAIV
jgi:hypothetical protein